MFEKKWLEYLLGLVFAGLVVFVGVKSVSVVKGWPYIGDEIETKNEISVSGEGEVFVKPDLAKMTFSVITEDSTVEGALNSNSSKMNDVIDRMKKEGVEEEDLKTISFSIHPRYEYREIMVSGGSQRVLAGYEVRQSLSVQTNDMDKIGEIISAGTQEGANSVGNVSFVVEDEEGYKEEARKIAIDQARDKAKAIAKDLGVRLGDVTGFNEDSGNSPILYRADMAEGMSGGTPNIETGENGISVSVTIKYEIK